MPNTPTHLANCDVAQYYMPVHRNVPDLDILPLEEKAPAGSPIQAKGIGNAICNACDARAVPFPMTPERVLAAIPE